MGCSADEVQPQSGLSRPPPTPERARLCLRSGPDWETRPSAPHADILQFFGALGHSKKGLVCFMVSGFAFP